MTLTNEFAIESFIEYCDDMMIATEAIDFKKISKSIFGSIRNIITKLTRWFKNLLMNINYFKNATLSVQMNSDILKVLQMSQARTEAFFKILPKIYTRLSKSGTVKSDTTFDGYKVGIIGNAVTKSDTKPSNLLTDGKEVYRDTTFNDQVHRFSTDIVNNMEVAKKSDAYKRLMKNEYADEVKPIPLSSIIPDMKNSQSNLAKMEDELTNMEKLKIDEKDTDAVKTFNQVITFIKHTINYYNFRIQFLSKYFKAAKISLLGIKNNLKEKGTGDNRSTTSFKAKKSFNFKATDRETYDKIKQLYQDALKTETYEEYKPMYEELTKLLKIGRQTIRKLEFHDMNIIGVTVINEKNSEIPITKGQKLYHTSPAKFEVSEITPKWTATHGALYPAPRAYFHMTIPLDRHGNRADTKFGGHIYEIAMQPEKIFTDRELGLTAVYVESTKPVPVKEIDYKEWKRVNDINLGIEK